LGSASGSAAADVVCSAPAVAAASYAGPGPASREALFAVVPETRTRGNRRLIVRRALVEADIVALVLAYLAASLADPALTARANLVVLAVALTLWVVAIRACGLYDRDDRRPGHSTLDELVPLAQLLTAGTWCGLLVSWAVSGRTVTGGAAIFWGASIVLVAVARGTARAVVRRRRDYLQRTVIVGAGDVGQLVARKLGQHPEWGMRAVGFVDSKPRSLRPEIEDLPVLGPPRDLARVICAEDADRVIVAFSQDRQEELANLLRSARSLGVHVDVVPRLFETIGPVGDVNHIEGFPLVSLYGNESSRRGRGAKRALDVVVAAAALLVTLPLFAWIAWRVKRDSPGPVFFRQVRLGEGQRRFTLLKFRTMTVEADEAPHREYVRQIMHPGAAPTGNGLYKLDRSADVTAFGAWLRRTSLDELPQLINVLRGEMSLVGPRPCLAYETELFEPHHFDRFLVPSGMTGLWQVTARARATLKEALDLDAAYARSWSVGLDLWLLAHTPRALLRGGSTT
jgi:exopolysaccharide biosynthesis polyprenyl glycosylphosphotransferase